MIRTSFFVIIMTFIIAIAIFQDRNERRVALVLSATSLEFENRRAAFNTPTPDVALTLSKLGFEVIESIEPTRELLLARMREFAAAVRKADIGLIYYSGKIAQFSGRSYLIPVDVPTDNPRVYEKYGIPLDPLLYEMERSIRHSFVFLNACRLSGKASRGHCLGLLPIGAGRTVMISHATQAAGNKNTHAQNETAFVNALTANLVKQDEPINRILANIYRDVSIATGSRQVPWTENGQDKEFVLNTRSVPFEVPKSTPPKVASLLPVSLESPEKLLATLTENKPLSSIKPKAEETVRAEQQTEKTNEREAREPSLNLPLPEQFLTEQGLLLDINLPQVAEFIEEQERLRWKDKKQVRMDRQTAVRVLQKKLAEFSCYRGNIDGIWGRLSRKAAEAFSRNIGAGRLSDQPDAELFKAVASYTGPVCGRPCADNARRDGKNKCVSVQRRELPYLPVITVARQERAVPRKKVEYRKRKSGSVSSTRSTGKKYKRGNGRVVKHAQRNRVRGKSRKVRHAGYGKRSHYRSARAGGNPWAQFAE